MDLNFPPEVAAFRQEVSQWFKDNLPEEIRQRTTKHFHFTLHNSHDIRRWTKIMNDKGWAAPFWPAEYGGTGWDHLLQHVFEEERWKADAPEPYIGGTRLIGPVIYQFGSPEMKRRFLPPTLSGEILWAQGFSEPGSGSDLVSLKTRAEDKGDHWLVTGQKIWTSVAEFCDWGFFLVKTGNDPKPQKNISFLLIDLKTPGVTVRPIPILNGIAELNEVFLDNVKVPKENLVGEPNKGWSYAKFLLDNERTSSAFLYLNKRELERVKDVARAERVDGRPLIEQPEFKSKLARVEARMHGLEWSVLRLLCNEKTRYDVTAIASVLKVRGSEMQQLVTELALDAMGPRSLRYYPAVDDPLVYDTDPADLWPGYLQGHTSLFMINRAATIYGGSKEVQKGIIAKLAFGL
jgi:alkylation response protein AidB-like acyl-CoA dehydrogenase